ncbi:hypothetical protein DFH29DRAFT_1001357 [Suillus ampliporus]|nr:hypothetical protein DFH29DRAFT_1001357 [Suillus ampliporus]
MSQKNDNKVPVPKAQWSALEVEALLDYLITQVSKIAGTTFKNDMFTKAARQITEKVGEAGLQVQPKTMTQCRMKWTTCNREISEQSIRWDNVNGANIQGPLAELIWGQFLSASSSNKVMKPFKNSGWPFWPKMSQILPHSSTTATTSAGPEASSDALGLDMSMADATAASGVGNIPNVDATNTEAVDGFGWGHIMSSLPSPGPVAGGSILPPPPSSAAASSTGKCSHSDMILSATTARTSVLESPTGSTEKKPRLSAHGGSSSNNTGMLHFTSGSGKKATKDAASTATFMNL